MEKSINVLNEPLETCGNEPKTGFFRDGCCNTSQDDLGSHTICVTVTEEFLKYSLLRGNDLSTPRPEFGFPGLNDGDRWCLCASRWMQAYQQGFAPKVHLSCTHKRALELIPLDLLREHAANLN